MTGKKAMTGCNISHSKRSTKRRFEPNLQEKRVLNPATGKTMKVRLSTTALKTLSKWQKEGRQYDLRKLVAKE
jgi:large subunit ribosomal protein L28